MMSEETKQYKIKDRPATIFRTVKNKNNPYVMIDRRPIDNPALSFKAKGILTYLMSRPDGWEVSTADLVKHGKDGEAAIRAGLKELREAGHMKYTSSRNEGRITGWLIEVFEVANSEYSHNLPDSDFQQVENLQVENQDVENRGQVLSTLSTTELNNSDKKPKLDPIDHMLAFSRTKAPEAELSLEIESALKVQFGLDATGTKGGIEFINYAVKRTLKDGQNYKRFFEWWKNNGGDRKYWSFNKMRENWPAAFMSFEDSPAVQGGNFYA
jgi:hypothetical protein